MCVTGKLQNRSYQDRNGETRWVTEVIADEVNFVDSANSQQNPPAAPQTAQIQGFQPYDAAQDDDLPF